MKRFLEICQNIEFVVFRITLLVVFLLGVGYFLYFECHHLFR